MNERTRLGTDSDGADSEHIDVRALHDSILRERREPVEGFEPTPVWLVLVYVGIVGWIGVYLGLYSAGFASDRYNHRPAGPSAAMDIGESPKVDPLVLGKRLFSIHCVTCHQTTGLGMEGLYPPLVGSEWLLEDAATPARILLLGLSGPIDVQGARFNGSMPAFSDRMSDEQIAAVLTFVRQEWTNQAPAVDPSFVAAVRDQTDRSQAWTADELLAVREEPIDWESATEVSDESPP